MNSIEEKKATNKIVGANIQYEREMAHLTQDRLSELIGMEPKNLSGIERGVTGTSLTTLKKICNVLSVSSDYLLYGRTEKNDVQALAAKLEKLPPEQYEIAKEIILKLLEAFALREEEK